MSTELDRDIPMPEANDNYLNDSVMFQRRNTNNRVNVIVRKRYSDGNSIGRKNDNPILDTRKYRAEFDDGEVSEIMADVIAESMYAACNDDGNEYLMMESIMEYRYNHKAVTVADQKAIHRGQNSM